jgi:bisphosphoglycerate-dependent phosphoglycerate mutase family 1
VSLKDTVDRVMPFWQEAITPALRRGEHVLVAAHGNSLRGLVKFLSAVPDTEIPEFEIPTGSPLVYQLDDALRPEDRPLSLAREACRSGGIAPKPGDAAINFAMPDLSPSLTSKCQYYATNRE